MWLDFLTIELSAIDKLIDSSQEFDKKMDTTVGTASEDMKKLFTLWKSTERSFDELMLKAKYGEVKFEDEHMHMHELQWKKSILEGIFWTCVKEEFHLWEIDESIGVRRGFQIVTSKLQTPPGFGDFFRRLLGGGQ